MPIVVSPVFDWIQSDRTSRFRVVDTIEKQQFHSACIARKQTEVHAALGNSRAKRRALPLAEQFSLGNSRAWLHLHASLTEQTSAAGFSGDRSRSGAQSGARFHLDFCDR